MNNKSLKSILVFEYYTASGITDQEIISEAVTMIDSLLDDLSAFSESELIDFHFLVSKDFEWITNKYNSFKPLIINNDLMDDDVIDNKVFHDGIIGNNILDNNVIDNKVFHDGIIGNNVLDNNVLDNNVLDNNVLDNNVLDNNVLDNNVLDNNVLDNNVLDNNVLDNNVLDNNVLDNNVIDNKVFHDGIIGNNVLDNNVIDNDVINTNITDENLLVNKNIYHWLSNNANNFDGVIFISSEKDMHLYNFTKFFEDKKIKVYGSDSYATMLCSDKYETFRHLQGIVNQPKTFKFTLTNEEKWKIAIKNILKSVQDHNDENRAKIIAKPLNGVDGEDVIVISSEEGVNNLKNIYPVNSVVVVQEFIIGDAVSVSLLSDGKTAIPISLNKQYNLLDGEDHRYLGGKLPYDHPLKDKAFQIAKTAVESIPGIKGFVGVDLILNDDVYLLEINSRFTTPYVGLNKITKFNIGKAIIDLLDNKIIIDSIRDSIELDNIVKFKKNGYELDIEIL
ncbi:D-alanine--D-alanine ligase [Methanobrevibacter cuticularis]|uniref:D-alanine--D-alanine ligase n=1 Tax=Methanobrevibacter cuticularis TaxID=47311 RepID=A0A166CXP8_9EURY|nr:ATP-grasp domain-containing protein [Methanobrevibacter cuticularis]KZX14974.1 D-alanine--D-alanine ligase [Methanobrevibacter cuticularis]